MKNRRDEVRENPPKIKTRVPKLRFPEVWNAGEWSQNSLDDVFKERTEKNHPEKQVLAATQDNGVIPYEQLERSIIRDRKNLVGYKLVLAGDFIISLRSFEGGFEYSDFEGIISPAYTVIYSSKRIDEQFFRFYFKRDSFIRCLQRGLNNSARDGKSINYAQASSLQIQMPELNEQKIIAKCLSSFDELIAAYTQKLSALKAYKKGLMQQLFPAEGETVPRLRFPEFRDAPEWGETTLEEVVSFENGKAHENNIMQNGKFILVNSKFISTGGEVQKRTDDGFCLTSAEDVLMVMSDLPNGKALAKCFFVDVNNQYTVNQRICKLSPQKVTGKMLYYIIDRNPYYLDFDDGVKQTNLRKEDVLGCPLLLPALPEQEIITKALTSLDALISTQSAKLDALKQHKKALMQQLFPQAEEEE
jgi:type I restriction enzyme, S subunit